MEAAAALSMRPDDRSAAHSRWENDFLLFGLTAGGSVLILFLAWEGIEQVYGASEAARRALHYARGISTSLITSSLVAALAFHRHRERTRVLSEERDLRTGEAKEAHALLRLIVDNTPASLVVLDAEYRIVKANRTAERVHGGPLEGRACRDVMSACSETCADCPATRTFACGSSEAVPRLQTDPRTGEVLSIESHPVDLPDGRRFVLLVERIVTEQRKLQARLIHQEKMAAFGVLAAGIAHDLGNPLASIQSQLQILDEPSLTPESAAVIGTVRQEVERLKRLLREMVDFARRRRDEATLVSVPSVVEDALRLVRHDRRMREVKVVTDLSSETPPVLVVEDHLMQVVLNLVLNAVDAMPKGGALRLEVGAAGSRVALRVHDTGVGMDRHTLGRCFEPLFTTKGPDKGTGLGLSICRDIVQAAGGEIEVHSVLGSGTTAVIALPAASAGAKSFLSNRETRVA